jgi:hypothetical protein
MPEGTADSSEGAYVLRNGLKEAVGVRDGSPAVSCRVVGSNGKVTVVRE